MEIKYILLSACLFFTIQASAQSSDQKPLPPSTPSVFTYVEQMPEAGYDFNLYLKYNLLYPDSARKLNIQGRVIVRFVVNEDGSISDFTLLKGIGGGCDEEARRLVSNMPPWKPGKQNGVAKKVYYTIPVDFKLKNIEPAQTATNSKATIYTYVDQMPEPGYSFLDYFSRNFHYTGVTDTTFVSHILVKFIVNEDGSISNCQVLKGKEIESEVLKVVCNMPKWKPGKKNGKPVKVWYLIPIIQEPGN